MMDAYMCMLFVNCLTYYFSFLFFFVGNESDPPFLCAE
jgi:hypothetical protein